MELLRLAVNYRNAIEIALNNNELDFIPLFDNFPLQYFESILFHLFVLNFQLTFYYFLNYFVLFL